MWRMHAEWQRQRRSAPCRVPALTPACLGPHPALQDTSAELVEALQGTSLFLVGMMGSGKSTVGKLVAKALGYCFFDTDALIEQLAQKKVSDIFAEEGEASFREAETQVLAVSCPGGAEAGQEGGARPRRAAELTGWALQWRRTDVCCTAIPTAAAHTPLCTPSAPLPCPCRSCRPSKTA